MANGNDPAFPRADSGYSPDDGLTKREYAVIHFLAALIMSGGVHTAPFLIETSKRLANDLFSDDQ